MVLLVFIFFILAMPLGILADGTLCGRYLRREIAAHIRPQLRPLQGQLDYIEATLNYALQNRYGEPRAGPTRPPVCSAAMATAGHNDCARGSMR